MSELTWRVVNPSGSKRVVVTKDLPGDHWLEVLTAAGCRTEICTDTRILEPADIGVAIGDRCDGAIGQLTETWGEQLFAALDAAGAKVYSNYAVGYNNVDVPAATEHGIPVGNTPGVLTETTAEMAVSLTFAAARRVPEGDRFMRAGRFDGWLPTLLLGELLWRRTLGIVGAGRIGAAYARMMVEGHKMDVTYYDIRPNDELEAFVAAYSQFLQSRGEAPISCTRSETLDELLAKSDVVSLHPVLDENTRHLIDAPRLALMKANAVLVNASRGPVIDEAALVAHCRTHPDFRAGLDVFEDEPAMKPGLADLDNVVVVPHLGSATSWTRRGMASLAACNVAGILMGYPVSQSANVEPFLQGTPPKAAPSIVNARDLGLPTAQA